MPPQTVDAITPVTTDDACKRDPVDLLGGRSWRGVVAHLPLPLPIMGISTPDVRGKRY
jgi:hypothetical protein